MSGPPEDLVKESVEVISTSALNPQDKALLKFGEETIVKSAEVIRDFAKTMITIITGLFATYFAILGFLGVKEVAQRPEISYLLILPPVFFILGIIAFVFSIIPLFGTLSINLLDDIERIRKKSIIVKIIGSVIGLSLFVIGMTIMLSINLVLLTQK